MNPMEQAELEVLLQLVEHPGWAVMVRHTQERIDAFQKGSPFNIKDGDHLNVMKGMMLALNEVLALPQKLAALANPEPDPAATAPLELEQE